MLRPVRQIEFVAVDGVPMSVLLLVAQPPPPVVEPELVMFWDGQAFLTLQYVHFAVLVSIQRMVSSAGWSTRVPFFGISLYAKVPESRQMAPH